MGGWVAWMVALVSMLMAVVLPWAPVLVQLMSVLRFIFAVMLVRLMFVMMLCVVVFAFMLVVHVCNDAGCVVVCRSC